MSDRCKPLAIVAKCAECSTRSELFICCHCDEVICQKCIDKHQIKRTEVLKDNWNTCKMKYVHLCSLSELYTKDIINVETEINRIRMLIDQRYTELLTSIESERNSIISKIEEYVHFNLSKYKHKDILDEYDSIKERIDIVLQDSEVSDNIEDFLLELDHLNTAIIDREKYIQTQAFKYPSLSPTKPMSRYDIFGELQWIYKSIPMHNVTKKIVNDIRLSTTTINGQSSIEITNGMQNESTKMSEDGVSMSVTRRQKRWSVEAAGVPHFLCLLSKKNHLLFACDKFGSIDLYQLDSTDSNKTPRHLRQFELFPGNTINQQPQIIETFTVYTPFIVVSAHLIDQTDTSSIYFFDHRGCQQSTTCLQNFPVRQLSADIYLKCLWGIDRQQHSVYYHKLPMNTQQIQEYITERQEFIKFDRDFEPIRITHNQLNIAVIERNSQSAHVYGKQNKTQISTFENLLRSKGVFRLWNALLRDDDSMVLKLDEDLPPNSRPPSINHLILELNSRGVPISQVERTSVYGFAIGPNQEILLGCKRHQQNGLIECYI